MAYKLPDDPHCNLSFKMIIIGDSGCGKSCLMIRYVKNEFWDDYSVTLGVQYQSKSIRIDKDVIVKLQIWDTAGQQAYRSIVRTFYRGSAVVMLVYNITKKATFENLNGWLSEARENSEENTMFVLIGTHLDLEEFRQVDNIAAKNWVKQNNIAMFFETSAKTSENVQKAFDQITKQLFVRNLKTKRSNPQNIEETMILVGSKEATSDGQCC